LLFCFFKNENGLQKFVCQCANCTLIQFTNAYFRSGRILILLCSFTSIFKTNAKSIEDSENANFFFTTRSYFVQVTAYYEIKIHDIFLYQVLHSASLLFFIRISFITIGQVLTCTSFSSFRAETKKNRVFLKKKKKMDGTCHF